MASFTPKELMAPAQLTNSAATVYTPSGSNLGVIRTIQANCPNSGHSFTLSIGTDGAGTRIFTSEALAANTPLILNGWWVVPNGVDVQAFADAGSEVVLTFSGYEYG